MIGGLKLLTAFCGLIILLALAPAASAREAPISPGDRLHIQFSGELTVPQWATVVEVDAEDTSAATVAALNQQGLTTICYISAGSWERYRDDASDFPSTVLGRRLAGWPDERWLDVRNRTVLRPLMRQRVQRCAAKGFRAIEFDNVDGYSNRTGFAITRSQQLAYNRMLARMAKRNGLSPGLKNAVGLLKPLSRTFDWALNEECVRYRECAGYKHFTRKEKAVFILEYRKAEVETLCRRAADLAAFGQLKRLRLNGWSLPCR